MRRLFASPLLLAVLVGVAVFTGGSAGVSGKSTGLKLPASLEARKVPQRHGLINLTHLNFLTEPITVSGREMAIVHIYSESPKYQWVDAGGEGIACVDDVARAAIVYVEYFKRYGDKRALEQARRLLNFVMYMQAGDGEYYNFVTDRKGTINKSGITSFKSWSWWAARGQWALATACLVFKGQDPAYAKVLRAAYLKGERALLSKLSRYGEWDVVHGVKVPAWLLGNGSDLSALAVLGLAAFYEAEPNRQTAALMGKLAEGVAAYQLGTFQEYPFGAHPSSTASTALWHAWGSHQVAALARAGRLLKRLEWVKSAQQEADWFFTYLLGTDLLNEMAVTFNRKGQIAYGTSMLSQGFWELYLATGHEEYARYAGLAASWFFGNNMAQFAMYDSETGRGYDGINGANDLMVNRNAGAESTIEALMALLPLVDHPLASRYLRYREIVRSFASVMEVEDGHPVAGQPQYGRRDWTGEANFSNGRYYALAPGDAVEMPLPVAEDGEYYLYLAHLRQAAPVPAKIRSIPAVKAPGSVTIDGKLDDWAKVPPLAVNKRENLLRGGANWLGPEKDSFCFRIMWDDKYLYLAAEVRDPEHNQLDIGPGVWRGDALWVYMDTRGDGNRVDVKFTLAQTPNGPQIWDWRSSFFLPGGKLAWQKQEGGYVYEAAIPLDSLGFLKPEPGKQVGIEVGRGATGGGFMDWTGLDPDTAQNLAPLEFVLEPPVQTALVAERRQGPEDVAVSVSIDDMEPILISEAVSPDRDYLWLDRVTGLPVKLEAGPHRVRLIGDGKDLTRSSVLDALVLVPARQWKLLEAPDGQRLKLIRRWDSAMTEITEWKGSNDDSTETTDR